MMSNKLFNSSFEISLRILLLLNEITKPVSIDRIIAYDFITIYSKFFGLSDASLNGENKFAFSEFAASRKVTQKAIKEMVVNRLVIVSRSAYGMDYSISGIGKRASETLQSEYAASYRALCKKTHEKYASYSDLQLVWMINNTATKSLRR